MAVDLGILQEQQRYRIVIHRSGPWGRPREAVMRYEGPADDGNLRFSYKPRFGAQIVRPQEIVYLDGPTSAKVRLPKEYKDKVARRAIAGEKRKAKTDK